LLDAALQRVEALTRQQRESFSTAEPTDEPDKKLTPKASASSSAQPSLYTSESPAESKANLAPQSTGSGSAQPAQSAGSTRPLPVVLALSGEAQGSTQSTKGPTDPSAELGPAPLPPSEASGKRGNPSPDLSLENPIPSLEPVPRQSSPPLNVANLQLCRKVNGFGSCEPLPGATVQPGQWVLLYCEMTGLTYEATDAGYLSRLSARLELRAPESETVLWEQELGIARDVCSRARHDYYVSYRLKLPRSLSAGPYRLRIVQTDLAANHSVPSEIPVTFGP